MSSFSGPGGIARVPDYSNFHYTSESATHVDRLSMTTTGWPFVIEAADAAAGVVAGLILFVCTVSGDEELKDARHPYRDRTASAGSVGGRLGPARTHPFDAYRRRFDRGVPVVGVPRGGQDRHRVAARQHLPG